MATAHDLTLWLSQGDRFAGLRGVADTVLVDGAHSEAVLLALDQVKHWEPGRVHHHVQTGQLPAALLCQGLIQVEHYKNHKDDFKSTIYLKDVFIIHYPSNMLEDSICTRVKDCQILFKKKKSPIIHSNHLQNHLHCG